MNETARALVLTIVFVVAGCSDDGKADADLGPADAGRADLGAEAGESCTADSDCDDGRFCNGVAACSPGAADVDARGCVASTGSSCLPSQTCIEATRVCETACGTDRDADGDGVDASSCGGEDCDDSDADTFPGNAEVCDDHDEDCNPSTLGPDGDGDGFASISCCNPGAGGVRACGADCDDTRDTVSPSGAESCNLIDDDCDGVADEGVQTICYLDTDVDGYAALGAAPAMLCTCGDGFTATSPASAADCNDALPSVHPGQPDACDGIDTDCNGVLSSAEDADSDGYPTAACRALSPVGSAPAAADCNDGNPAIHPGVGDPCDGVDGDCDGSVEDMDGDSYSSPTATCIGGPFPKTDCNDAVGTVRPGGVETCNGVDDDCDSAVDGALATTWCDAAPRGDARSTYACIGGVCQVAACTALYGDCTAAAGCESYLPGNAAYCGSCTNRCKLYCSATTCDEATSIVAGAGALTTCAIRSSGQAVCWGRGDLSQIGNGISSSTVRTPTQVLSLPNAVQIDVGRQHACARRTSGQVSCWGTGTSGEIGNGSAATVFAPADVSGLTDAIDLSAGGAFSCAIRAGGRVVCWGYNSSSGELGSLGTSVGTHSTFVIGGVVDATQVTAGANHACAVRVGGQAVCWGANSAGQLGDDAAEPSTPTAVSVMGIANAVELRAGASHTCARRVGGSVSCWGFNDRGQLGDTTTTTAFVPVSTGIADATALAAGSRHTCAIVSAVRGSGAAASNVLCWGGNAVGNLGDGTTTDRRAPTPVAGLSDAIAIAAGGGDVSGAQDYSCALRATGQLVCWGANVVWGQLGDGTASARLTPSNVTSM